MYYGAFWSCHMETTKSTYSKWLLYLHVVQIRSWPWLRHQGNQANQRFESIKLSVQQSPKVPFWNYVPHEKSGLQLVPFIKNFSLNMLRKIMKQHISLAVALLSLSCCFYCCQPHNLGEKKQCFTSQKRSFWKGSPTIPPFWVSCMYWLSHFISFLHGYACGTIWL